MIVLIIAVYSFLVVFELLPLYKKKLWHDFWTNFGLTILSFTFAVLLNFGVYIPSPEEPIRLFIESIIGK